MSGLVVSALIGIVFVMITVTIMAGSYFVARKVLSPGAEGDRTHDVASAVATRIAALHGLILALVYAQELDDYKDVRSTLAQEAVAVADIFNDIQRYGGPPVAPVRAGLAQYVQTVVTVEWQELGERRGLAAQAWIAWDRVYNQLLDLSPQSDRQTFLANRMRGRATDIAGFRQMRESAVLDRFSELFWAPALIGLVLLAAPFYVYRPTRTHLVLFAVFGAYSGMILFFIYAFSNPFARPGRLEALPFVRLLEGDLGKALPPNGQDFGANSAGSKT
ncbi:MAG: DUF4239 domain-containing protein [Methylobacterium mesophilicum]|nr:DUF4239 domain-containing protein [Methylobacterium mesophilicum]